MAHTESIGRYRVVGTLGQGAMGRVYLAYDPGLDMHVAIKLIKRDNMIENQVVLLRFRREAALGARIRHPNIVAIYDVGQDINHGPYMVMEHVDGRELLDILKENSATVSEKLDWLRQIADALRCAHEVGIIHRDVKPANILVAKDGRAKLIDFGVAKVVSDQVSARPRAIYENVEEDLMADKHATAWGLLRAKEIHDDDEPQLEVLSTDGSRGGAPWSSGAAPVIAGNPSDNISQMGALIGTPCYTAPELLNGEPPSSATDHFAFSVTAFQALLGQLPFWGRNTLERIRNGLLEFPDGIDPTLRTIFEKALCPNPRVRYADLDAFLGELYQAYGLERPPSNMRPGRIPGRMPSRNAPVPSSFARVLGQWAKLIGGGLAVILVAGLGLKRWLASSAGLDEITVHTQPSGASIFVDDLYLGQSPLDNIALPKNARRLRVLKKQYQPVDRSLTPSDGFVSLVMQVAPFDMNIETAPSGAEILLDGKVVGTSPFLLKQISVNREHTLELRLKGFATKRMLVDPLNLWQGPITLEPESQAIP